jgi:hypothetical protein
MRSGSIDGGRGHRQAGWINDLKVMNSDLNLSMIKNILLLILLCSGVISSLSAQEVRPPDFLTDSSDTRPLNEVIIKAYEQNRKLTEVGAPVNVVSKASLNRFANISILPALNTNPGVRMEERSPGSYRLNIRGSSIRSPFGVRDVKIYWNEIPLTDPGGNTYLNELGFYNFQSLEIIKGTAGSLYGNRASDWIIRRDPILPIRSMPVSGWEMRNTAIFCLTPGKPAMDTGSKPRRAATSGAGRPS